MMKVLRDFLRIYWKEQASNNQQLRKANFLVYDEYMKKYVCTDELLTPGIKDIYVGPAKLANKKSFVFDILLKKFVNPKLDLLNPGLKSLYHFKLTGMHNKQDDFRLSSKNYFWGKKKTKKHAVIPLPPVHKKTDLESESSEVGWAGQKTIKPQTDIRPEHGQPECVLGPGKDPNKKKPPGKKKKNKNYLICGKTKEIQNETDTAKINHENSNISKDFKYDEENVYCGSQDKKDKLKLKESQSDFMEKHIDSVDKNKAKEEMYLDNLLESTKNKTGILLKSICQTLFSKDESIKAPYKQKNSFNPGNEEGVRDLKDDTFLNKNQNNLSNTVSHKKPRIKNLLEEESNGLKSIQSKEQTMKKQCSSSEISSKYVKTTKLYLCKGNTDKFNNENKSNETENSCIQSSCQSKTADENKCRHSNLEPYYKKQIKGTDQKEGSNIHVKKNTIQNCGKNKKFSNLNKLIMECKHSIPERPSTSLKETSCCSKAKEDSNNYKKPSYNFMARPKTACLLRSSSKQTLLSALGNSKKDCKDKLNEQQASGFDHYKKDKLESSACEQSKAEEKCDEVNSQEVNPFLKKNTECCIIYHDKSNINTLNTQSLSETPDRPSLGDKRNCSKKTKELFSNRQVQAQCTKSNERMQLTCKTINADKSSEDKSKDAEKQKPPKPQSKASKCLNFDQQSTEKLQFITQEKLFENAKLSTDLFQCNSYLGFKVKKSCLNDEPKKENNVMDKKTEIKKTFCNKVHCNSNKKVKSKTSFKNKESTIESCKSESNNGENRENSKSVTLLNPGHKEALKNNVKTRNTLQTKPTHTDCKEEQSGKKSIPKIKSSAHIKKTKTYKSAAKATEDNKNEKGNITKDDIKCLNIRENNNMESNKISKPQTVNKISNDTSIENNNCCDTFSNQNVSYQDEQECCGKSKKELDKKRSDEHSFNKACDSESTKKKICPIVKEDTEEDPTGKSTVQNHTGQKSSMKTNKSKSYFKDFKTGTTKRKKSKLCKRKGSSQSYKSVSSLNKLDRSEITNISEKQLKKERKSAEPFKRSKSASVCSENETITVTKTIRNKSQPKHSASSKSDKSMVSQQNHTKLNRPASQKEEKSSKLQKLAGEARCQQTGVNKKKNTVTHALICSQSKPKTHSVNNNKVSKSLEKIDSTRKKPPNPTKKPNDGLNQPKVSKSETKNSKMCYLQTLQKRVTENPIKMAKRVEIKSFSDLKSTTNKPKNSISNTTFNNGSYSSQLNLELSELKNDSLPNKNTSLNKCCMKTTETNIKLEDAKESNQRKTNKKTNVNSSYPYNSFKINTFILNKSKDFQFKVNKKGSRKKLKEGILKYKSNQNLVSNLHQPVKNESSLNTKNVNHQVGSKYPVNATLIKTHKDSIRHINPSKSKSFSSFSAPVTHEKVMKHLVNPIKSCYTKLNKNIGVKSVTSQKNIIQNYINDNSPLARQNIFSDTSQLQSEKEKKITTDCKDKISKGISHNRFDELVLLAKQLDLQTTKSLPKCEEVNEMSETTNLKKKSIKNEQNICNFNPNGICLEKLQPKYMSKTVKHIINSLKNSKNVTQTSEVLRVNQENRNKLESKFYYSRSKCNSPNTAGFNKAPIERLSTKQVSQTKYKLETIFSGSEKTKKYVNLERNPLVNENLELKTSNQAPYAMVKDKRLDKFSQKDIAIETKNYNSGKRRTPFVNEANSMEVKILNKKIISSKPNGNRDKAAKKSAINVPESNLEQEKMKNKISKNKIIIETPLTNKFLPKLKSKFQLISKRNKKVNKKTALPVINVKKGSNQKLVVTKITKPYPYKLHKTNNIEHSINVVKLNIATSLSAKQSRSLMEQPFYKTCETKMPLTELLSSSKSQIDFDTQFKRNIECISQPAKSISLRCQLQGNVRVKSAASLTDLKNEEHE